MSLFKLLLLTTIIVTLQAQKIDCPSGFDLVPPRQQFGICVVVGCSKPIKNQLCYVQCIEGFAKTSTQSCEVLKCVSPSKTLCTSCQSGYQLQALPANPLVRVCVPTNCQQINKATRKCEICQTGFSLSQNGTCSLVNCDIPSDDFSRCSTCKQGYTLTKVEGGISVCAPKNCIKFSNTTYQCLQCQSSFIIDISSGVCQLGLKNCANFNQFSGLCYQCVKGYQIVALRACIKEDQNCLQYDVNGCTECKPAYQAVKGSCQANFCDLIDDTNPLLCKKCQPGFILNQNNICQLQNCQIFDKNSWRCNQCTEFFELVSTTSVSNPNIIVQRCITKFCQIFDNNRVNCSRCDIQHTLFNGTCILSNCQKEQGLSCAQCIEGWTQNQNGNCVLFDCLDFVSPTRCRSCITGKRLYKNTCIRDNCMFRMNDGTCAQCPILYQIHPKFQQFCVTQFCNKIDETSGDCLECIANYKLNQKGLCTSTVCTQYQKKAGFIDLQCTNCTDGYQPQGKICIASTKYCRQYKFQTGTCNNCTQGYQLINNKTLCAPIKCKINQIKSTYTNCKQCNLGYQPITLESGLQQCSPFNCSKVVQGNCTTCVEGFALLADICIAVNCRQYNNQGFCIQCKVGFYLDPAKLICVREKCVQNSGKSCIKCQLGFYPDNSTSQTQGLCRPFNCQTVIYVDRKNITDKKNLSTVLCQKCANGFTRLPNIQMCVALDCLSQDASGLCKSCRMGFSLKDGKCNMLRNNDYCPQGRYPGANLLCEPIRAKNCLLANPRNTNQCYKCQQDYFLLLSDKTCRTYNHCLQKNFYLGCLKCQPGFKINVNGQCQGSVPNCKSYDPVNGQCQLCGTGLQLILYPNKICAQIPDFCTSLDPWGFCAQCKAPNSVLTKDKQCIIQINNCEQYNLRGICSNCSKGYYISGQIINPTCVPNPVNCQLATYTGQCLKCNENFIQITGACYDPIQNCIKYGPGVCTRCQAGYYVDTKSKCSLLPKYCDQVILNTDGICDKCRSGFTNTNGICVRNIEFCVSYDSETGKCTGCTTGYSLSSTQSLCLLGNI